MSYSTSKKIIKLQHIRQKDLSCGGFKEIVLIISSEDKITFCEICDFKSVSKKVLDVHIKRKHCNIRELDGNMKLKNTSNCEFCDTKFCREG